MIGVCVTLILLNQVGVLQFPREVEVIKYTVQEGDTFSSIAQEYSVSVSELEKLNWLYKNIKEGQVIEISPQTMTDGFYMTILEGNTLEKIAYDHGISVEKLMELNSMSSEILTPGTKIFVPNFYMSN